MIIIKRKFMVLLLGTALLFSQFLGIKSTAAEDILTITHVAKVPNGREYTFGTETIGNITDIYYYNTSQSPVAKEILARGFELANTKNERIEADIVENGGEITLEYLPKLQDVKVSYFKINDGVKEEMGTITDKAYVGETYRALLPLEEGELSQIEIIENPEHIVAPGDNRLSVVYELREMAVEESQSQDLEQSIGFVRGEGKGAELTNLHISKEGRYIFGYPDNSFKPDKNLSRKEMLHMLRSLAGGGDIDSLKKQGVLAEADFESLDEEITWSAFYEALDKLDKKLGLGNKRDEVKNSYWSGYFHGDKLITRAEAVAVVNEIQGRKINEAVLIPEREFNDVHEDHWAYEEILKASTP